MLHKLLYTLKPIDKYLWVFNFNIKVYEIKALFITYLINTHDKYLIYLKGGILMNTYKVRCKYTRAAFRNKRTIPISDYYLDYYGELVVADEKCIVPALINILRRDKQMKYVHIVDIQYSLVS